VTTTVETRLVQTVALLHEWRDVLEERVADGRNPSWAARRGWEAFLGSLGDDDLARCEREGARALASLASAPPDLVALARDVAGVVAVREAAARAGPPDALHGVPSRKSGQVRALVELCRERDLAPRRVVDVGAGAGHLTRALAHALGVEAVGLECDAGRVERARARSVGDRGARFEPLVVAPASLVLEPGDLAVGLHACGALGDALVEVAARDGADLILVACCPQKVSLPQREALSLTGREQRFTISGELLGLANAFEGAPDLDAHAVRFALRWILRARGLDLGPGQESRGLTPRCRRKLATAAERALSRRGLAPASEAEQREALEFARFEMASARRWTLPRRWLAQALEVALALDRARALEEAGGVAEVVRLFPRELSPRNLAVVAIGRER
jgi:hypothetical protein